MDGYSIVSWMFLQCVCNLFLFSYDLRGDRPESGRHWSDSHALGSRALFFMRKPITNADSTHPESANSESTSKEENLFSYLRIQVTEFSLKQKIKTLKYLLDKMTKQAFFTT